MLHALDGIWQPAKELRGLVGHKLMGRQRPSVTSRMLSLVIDLADLLLRHGCANHRRETIAFSKRRQAAMAAGLPARPLTWLQVLARRRFPAHVALPRVAYYWARVKTLVYGDHQRVHALKWAF